MSTFLNIIVFAAGFTVCWYVKDAVIKAMTGTEAFVKMLETKVAALKAVL